MIKVTDHETGNYLLYKGECLENAFEEIRDSAKVNNEYAEDFEDCEDWDLYKDYERIWCGKTDTISELVDVCFPNPWLNKKVEDYIDALVNYGSDPMRIEDNEQAINAFLSINDNEVMIQELTDEYDLECAEALLDLEGCKHGPVYTFGEWNQEHYFICFDYEMK